MKRFLMLLIGIASWPLAAMRNTKNITQRNIHHNQIIAYSIYTNYKNKNRSLKMDTRTFEEHVVTVSKEIKNRKKRHPLNFDDIYKILYEYHHIEKNKKTKQQNIFFVDTILPVLFENHDFSTLIKSNAFCKEQIRFLSDAAYNPYLLSHYVYHYNFPLKRYAGKESALWNVAERMFFKKIKNDNDNYILSYKEKVQYIFEKMITPPTTWITQQKKEILVPIETFLLTLKYLAKENYIYKVPKPLIKLIVTQIFSLNVNIHHLKTTQRFEKIKNDLLDEWKLCIEESEHSNIFLELNYEGFEKCNTTPMLLKEFSESTKESILF